MNIFRSLFLLFLIVPIIEIFLLIKVGGIIGAVPTILAIVATAVIGAFLLRSQGVATLNRVQKSLKRGEIPAIEMFEGVILLICGALLLTPGFFTDAIGFIALIPTTRRIFIVWALKQTNIIHAMKQAQPTYESPDFHRHDPQEREVIEGEFKKDDK